MREIKFRVWDKIGNRFFNIDYNYLVAITNCGKIGVLVDDFNFEEFKKDELENIVISEYTGIKDKNDKEIYEGDIIKDKLGRIYKVFWHGSFAGFCYEFKNQLGKKDFKLLHLAYFNIEVIGNIYENSELLRSDENGF